ncbi:MAG: walR1 [Clostridia bacterium]|nr:walR1 [Clostridia bacterium]
MNILIVDDEKLIVKGLMNSLEQNGFQVYVAYDGKKALEMVNFQQLDLILLDIMLPEIDGITLCKKIREKNDIPIIMLTAKDDYIDKVLGLEFGADDYVTKPFHTRELIARINAVYRRYIKKHDEEEVLQVDSFKINILSRTVLKGEREIELTSKEFELLKTLIKSPGRVFTRENLFDIVWNENIFDTRTVDVHISNLREKVEEDAAKPQLIKTKWGVGYYFKRG